MAIQYVDGKKRCSKCASFKDPSEFYKCSPRPDGKQSSCIACHQAYVGNHLSEGARRAAKWRALNPDKQKEVCRKYREKNTAQRAAWSKAWREANKQRVAEYQAVYEAARRDKRCAQKRSDYDSKASCARSKEWRANNPDKKLAAKHRYRARKRGVGGTYTVAARDALLMAQSFLCANPHCCEPLTVGNRTIDHIVALANGGSNDIINLQWLCRPCNSRKSNLDPAVWLSREASRLTQ